MNGPIENLMYIHQPRAEGFVKLLATQVALGNRYFSVHGKLDIGLWLSSSEGIVLFGRQKGIWYDSPEGYMEFMEIVKGRRLPVAAVLFKQGDRIDRLPKGHWGVDRIVPNEYGITSIEEMRASLVNFFGHRPDSAPRDVL